MIKIVTFAVIVVIMTLYYRKLNPSAGPKFKLPKAPKVKMMPKQKTAVMKDFWVQVYDTDSEEEVRKLQTKCHNANIQCFIYQQGKKDIHGAFLKHYGISVPRESFEKSQSIIAEITL